MESQYYIKYMKYKAKYLKLQEQLGLARKHKKSQKHRPKKHHSKKQHSKKQYEDYNNYDNDNDNDNNYDNENYDDDLDYDDEEADDDKLAGVPKSIQKCLKQLDLSNFTDNPDVMNIIAQYLQDYLQQYGKNFISDPENLKKLFKKLPKFI